MNHYLGYKTTIYHESISIKIHLLINIWKDGLLSENQ